MTQINIDRMRLLLVIPHMLFINGHSWLHLMGRKWMQSPRLMGACSPKLPPDRGAVWTRPLPLRAPVLVGAIGHAARYLKARR